MPSELDLKQRGLTAQLTAPGAPLALGTARRHGVELPTFGTVPPSIPAYVELYCTQHGDATFLVDGDLRLTFAETLALARRMARGLITRHGVTKGDHVGIAARNSINYIIAYLGVLFAGGCVTMLNGWWTSEELVDGIDLAECKLVLADPQRAERLGDLNHHARVAAFDHGAPEAGLAGFLAGADDATPLPELAPEDSATIMFTSGSTGQSKAALSDHLGVVQATASFACQTMVALMLMQADGKSPQYQPCSLVCVPLFHVTAEVPLFLQSFVMGRKLVLMPKWDAKEAMRLIEAERATYFVGVPLMSFELATHPERTQFDLSSCMHYAAGGAPRPVSHVKAIREAFPNSYPVLGYGLTETNGVGCGNVNENYLAKPGSTGPATPPLVDLAILDDAGQPVAQGVAGEVAIRTVCNIKEYYRNPEATAAAFNAQGYFLTGDLGYLDEDGYLFIVDRKKEIVIRGGENIACAEVEAAIYAHPDVAEACVFGLPHQRFGEVPVAVYVPVEGKELGEEALRDYLKAHIAAFKIPAKMWVYTGHLPRLGTEKVDRRAVKARFAEGWDASTA
ncbi:MAG: acyl--CoA ligase [Proteobacteria bacterium]|nr:acyl--CoA ligase [Pseudomonadota bacterium]